MQTTASGGRGRYRLIAAIGVLAALVVGTWFVWGDRSSTGPYDPPPISFQGKSTALRQTVIVPTLNTPIPPGKSAIWCSSLELAWNRLKTDVVKEPIRLRDGGKLVEELNQSSASESDLDSADLYTAAGLARDGIVRRIQTEMAQKFPNAPQPDLSSIRPDGAVAYSYLGAHIRFAYPFFKNDEESPFVDSAGKQGLVDSFGVRKKDEYAYDKLRSQVELLYVSPDRFKTGRDPREFILDPDRFSQPYQLILARVRLKETLYATLADVRNKIENLRPADMTSEFAPADTLAIPSMNWFIEHHHRELQGKEFLNAKLPGATLGDAVQMIQFRLDRSGAALRSEAKLPVKHGPTHYQFDRPFLIFLQKRGTQKPFFVMWVDNSELLSKK